MHRFAADPPIQHRVGDQLATREDTVATAESFTGGLVGGLLTEVPGASDYFDRAVVTYTYEAKMDELAVQREILEDLGAVNEIVAEQMARAIRDMAGTTWGVSTTGVAGPESGAAGTPIGTAFVGVAHRAADSADSFVTANEYRFQGNRSEIRELGARQALEDLSDTVGERP